MSDAGGGATWLGRVSGLLTSGLAVGRSGLRLANDDAVARRLAICRSCPESGEEDDTVRCAVCGCNMKVKAMFEAMNCPLKQSGRGDLSLWGE